MKRLQFIKAKAIDARKNYSWGSSVREVWFKDDSGKESVIEFSGPFPVRSGNLLGLVYASTLTDSDPLLLIGTNPASARSYAVKAPLQVSV